MDLYLASGSPRRRDLLRQIGVRFAVVCPDVVECRNPHEPPLDYVRRLALEKARAGWARVAAEQLPLAPVLGADTLGILGGELLEKPCDQAHAARLLRQMSGRVHQVVTAVAITNGDTEQVVLSETQVEFRVLNDDEINRYWFTGEPVDKAGGYGIQGMGAVFVKRIQGSYSNVVGLPIEATVPLLTAYNVPWWQASEPDNSGGALR